jgi:hypothetical protein
MNAYQILVGKVEGKTPLERSISSWRDYFKKKLILEKLDVRV